MTHRRITLSLLGAGTLIAGCASTEDNVPVSYVANTPLERNQIGVAENTAFLEIPVRATRTRLSLDDRAQIAAFFREFKRVGSGPLVMSLPSGGVNAQSAVRALAEAREIAYELGVDYTEIAGGNYPANGRQDAPLVFAFTTYEAIAPDCPTLASVDVSDTRSNNELPTLGCAVRTNMAAMIAEPGDLLGTRPLGEGDVNRRQLQTEQYRRGETTAASRTEDERGDVSSAVR